MGKFKVDDRVIYVGPSKITQNKIGTIKDFRDGGFDVVFDDFIREFWGNKGLGIENGHGQWYSLGSESSFDFVSKLGIISKRVD